MNNVKCLIIVISRTHSVYIELSFHLVDKHTIIYYYEYTPAGYVFVFISMWMFVYIGQSFSIEFILKLIIQHKTLSEMVSKVARVFDNISDIEIYSIIFDQL